MVIREKIQPAIIFDFGGVLIDWNPRHLFRKIFNGGDLAVEEFLEETHFYEWNILQDAGRPFKQAISEICSYYPQHCEKFIAYEGRFIETISGPIWPTVNILEQIKLSGYPLFGLSNWSAETFPIIRDKYSFFDLFDDIVISGAVGVVKPDPAIFKFLLERIGREAADCLFIDDSMTNIETANRVGFQTIHYSSSDQLMKEMGRIGIID